MDDSTFLLSSLLSSLEFAFQIPEKLLCESCNQAAISPWRTKCNHLLCWRCMNETLRCLQKCPVDGTRIIIGEGKLERDIDDAVRSLLVRCPYQKHGCGTVISLGKITEHMEVCSYLPVYCPKECGLTILRKNIVQHIISSCPGTQTKQQRNVSQTIEDIKRTTSKKELPLLLQSTDVAFNEMQDHFPELNQNGSHLLHGSQFSKSTNAINNPAVIKRRKAEIRNGKHRSMSEIEILQQFGDTGYLNFAMQNFKEFNGKNGTNKLLEMMHLLVERVDDMNSRMVTKESLNQVAATLLDRIEVFQSSLRIHYKKLEVLEASNKTLEEVQAKTLEESEKSVKYMESLIDKLDDFTNKVNAQSQAWTQIVDHIEKPWLKETQNGTFLWKITDYSRRKQRAARGMEQEVYSQPFFTHLYGYKLCLRAYLNGYCDGEGSHISVYICLMKGPFDELLSWPFKSKFTFYLLDQKHPEKKEHFMMQVDSKKMGQQFTKWCQKPENERNVGFGIPEFISHAKLEKSVYLHNDCIYLKVVVNLTDNDKKEKKYP